MESFDQVDIDCSVVVPLYNEGTVIDELYSRLTKTMGETGLYYELVSRLIPESRMKAYKKPKKTIPRVKDSHEQDWVRACKAGRAAGADFEYSGLLTEVCLLGNVAKRVDSRIEWDKDDMKVTNLPEANKYIRTRYREGWTL